MSEIAGGKRKKFSEYKARNNILAELGFEDYKTYRESDLWKSIRRRVLSNRKCCCCHGRASQVHHKQYTKANLSGESLEHLVSICRDCHYAAEFTKDGKKRTLSEANAWISANKCQEETKKKKRRKKKKKCKKNRPACAQQCQQKLTRAQKAARKAAKKEACAEKRLLAIVKNKLRGGEKVALKKPRYVKAGTPIRTMYIGDFSEWKNDSAPKNQRFTKALYNIGEYVFNVGDELWRIESKHVVESIIE